MKHALGLSAGLVGTWLALSGHFDSGLLFGLGAASCALVLIIARRMRILDPEGVPLHLPFRLLGYLPWLFGEIAKANVDVARRILSPRLPISPRVIQVRAGQPGEVERVIYANSITLTPGTVSIETQGDVITVHALTTEAAESLLTGEMDRRAARLAGRG